MRPCKSFTVLRRVRIVSVIIMRGAATGWWPAACGIKAGGEVCSVRLPRLYVPLSECRLTSKAAEYRGTRSYTSTYRACQRWDRQTPHGHSLRHGWMFSDGNVTAADDRCRNPGGVRARPWCFTSDPAVVWEYCAIPLCGAYRPCLFTSPRQNRTEPN